MSVLHDTAVSSTENRATLSMSGHKPLLFKGQKADILSLLVKNRGNWVPSYSLSAVALQYSARVKELRDAGYVIENKTARHGRQVHGSFRLVACPGDEVQR
jgi:hypothetical protein